MASTALIHELGYGESPRFIAPAKADELPAGELSFALRHTAEVCEELRRKHGECRFHGSYLLQEKPRGPAIPVVYLFETDSEAAARDIHRMVWNQNLVPFVIIQSPGQVRVYPGFAYVRNSDKPLLSIALQVGQTLSELSAFRATSIDDGIVWQRWGSAVDPSGRVDETLLRHLEELDSSLRHQGLSREASHGLIGKFVYLYYLRHREILSDRKLEKWQVDPQDLFSRNATLKAFRAVNDGLQEWLNGSVFNVGETALAQISQAQLRLVAGVFAGDTTTGQLHLDFNAYDFSHIPIETLSCVYEQFLHDADVPHAESRGKTLGAYYTPLPLADYVIGELERKRPLKEGMRVLDPACGSGVFLVECYRRLIEKKIRNERRPLKATELRELLVENIYGIDRDDDACRVAELSLVLTLLDYVSPPDLESTNFQLPTLRQANIFQDDFFDLAGAWAQQFQNLTFDWIVGNPPWAEVNGSPSAEHEHFHVGKWIVQQKSIHPTGGNQIAEAFLWKVGDHLSPKGVSGLLVPAMTWFKKESVAFRHEFFATHEVWGLTNFANLAYVLFAGRAEVPASAVFFHVHAPSEDHRIATFAPFVAEQVANRPQKANRRSATWNIVVNGAELREVPNSEAVEGGSSIWKLAMWGCARDGRLFEQLEKRFASFQNFAEANQLIAHQGIELRTKGQTREQLEHHPNLAGKLRLDTGDLRGTKRIFNFPNEALKPIPAEECYVRKGRSQLPLAVSEPPHIVVDASRRFAIFSKSFVAIPPRQVGIAGPKHQELLLRALSVYLSSDFCVYHQFFASPQWGIDMNRADLNALRTLPIAIAGYSATELEEWAALQKELAALSGKQLNGSALSWTSDDETRLQNLSEEANRKVLKSLGLRSTDRWLVEDFVRLNLELNKGKVTKETVRSAHIDEIKLYLTTLRDCLDEFVSADRGVRHELEALVDKESAIFSIALRRSSEVLPPKVTPVDESSAKTLHMLRDQLRKRHSQWLYFDRNVKVYDRGVLYQMKPTQRLHWTRRQAVIDADEIIVEAVFKGAAA